MKWTKLISFAVLGCLTISSCTMSPQHTLKMVEVNPTVDIEKPVSCKVGVSVDYSDCTGILDTYSVYIQTKKHQFEALSDYNWSDTPCNMIKTSLEKALAQAGFSLNNNSRNQIKFKLIEFKPVFQTAKYCKLTALVNIKVNNKTKSFLFKKKLPILNNEFVGCLNKITSDFDKFCLDRIKKEACQGTDRP